MRRNLRDPHLGPAELELLRFVLDRGETTGRAAAEHFAETRGYARTTVLKTLERLRTKERLVREDREGGNVYRATMTREELDTYVVEDFVHISLGGSVSPLFAFLMQKKGGGLSPEDAAEMRRLVDELEEKKP
ncbi:MAG: BlaI/MecI/CopY family transcriptional regulator [Fimbriimonas sp.]